MKNLSYYVVCANDKDGSPAFLNFDERSGGYPYWESNLLSAKGWTSKEKALGEVERVKRDFSKRSGEYYKQNIDPSNVYIYEIGVVEVSQINIKADDEAIRAELMKSIKSKLTPEEFEMFMQNKH